MYEETEFEKELKELINKHSVENDSGTPDWLLAKYLTGCLIVYTSVVMAREKWYNRELWPSPELN